MFQSDLLDKLEKFVAPYNLEEFRNAFHSHFHRYLLHVWSPEDVIGAAKYFDPPVELTEEQAIEVLDSVKIDSQWGVSWDTITECAKIWIRENLSQEEDYDEDEDE